MTQHNKVLSIKGQVVKAEFGDTMPQLGEICQAENGQVTLLNYLSADENQSYLIILSGAEQLERDSDLVCTGEKLKIQVGPELLGRMVNAFGQAVDGELLTGKSLHSKSLPDKSLLGETNQLKLKEKREILQPVVFESRPSQDQVWETGIKVIDFFTPLLKGGRLGLFGGAGVGKTVLLTEIMNNLFTSRGREKSQEQESGQGEENEQGKENEKQQVAAIFGGVGERSREGQELYQELKDKGVLDQTSLVISSMGDNAAIRFITAYSAITVAEYFRDQPKQDVLFFIDNVFRFAQAGSELATMTEMIPSEEGYQATLSSEMARFQERLVSSERGDLSAIEAIYVPSDDLLDQAVVAAQPYLDSGVTLSREVYQSGRYPAVDILNSSSSALHAGVVGEEHFAVVLAAKKLLQESQHLERMVALVGESELSPENRKIYHRANLLKAYMTQPFSVVAEQTGLKGVQVKLSQVVADVNSILTGERDELKVDEAEFRGKL